MSMHIGIRALFAVAVLCLAGFRAGAAEDLSGVWSAEQRTKGGLGAQIVLTPTETTSTFGALVDGRYEIDGNRLRMFAGTQSPGAPGSPFTIEGNKLTISQGEKAAPLVMTRVGAPHPGAHPIVGDWTYQHSTGAQALQRFSSNGTVQLSVVMQVIRGPYTVNTDTLTMHADGRAPVTLTYRREGNVLITTDARDRTIRYVRFEY